MPGHALTPDEQHAADQDAARLLDDRAADQDAAATWLPDTNADQVYADEHHRRLDSGSPSR